MLCFTFGNGVVAAYLPDNIAAQSALLSYFPAILLPLSATNVCAIFNPRMKRPAMHYGTTNSHNKAGTQHHKRPAPSFIPVIREALQNDAFHLLLSLEVANTISITLHTDNLILYIKYSLNVENSVLFQVLRAS